MQILNKKSGTTKTIVLTKKPTEIIYQEGSIPLAVFGDGKNHHLGCMRCRNPKCAKLSPEQFKADFIKDFSYDLNENVCPTAALTIDPGTRLPNINRNLCIMCGACIRACPVGALYFSKEVKINTTLDEYQVEQEETLENQFPTEIRKTGTLVKATTKLIEQIYLKLQNTDPKQHNLIARNILIALGCQVSSRRIGDVYTRMDLVYRYKKTKGEIEVEFGKDSLDVSRGLLDDIAIMNVRYGLKKENSEPLALFLQLPNERQGYWQVVKDISKVESIKIKTLTIAALLLMNWNLKQFPDSLDGFYVDYDNMEIRTPLEKIIGDTTDFIPKNHLGILEPEK